LASILNAGRKLVRFAQAVSVIGVLLTAWQLNGQNAIIDCTGGGNYSPGSGVYPSFSQYHSALNTEYTGWTGSVTVYGTCVENVYIANSDPAINVSPGPNDEFRIIGAAGATIRGNLTIVATPSPVYLQNLTIEYSSGDGIDVNGSNVTLDSCKVNNNIGNGVSIDNSSHVLVTGSKSQFNDNQGWAGGFSVFGHSYLDIAPAGQGFDPLQIQGNTHAGIWASQADVTAGSNILISDNGGPVSDNGVPGVVLLGGTRAQFGGDINVPSHIQNQKNGGILLRENSEISLYGWIVQNNGKFGIDDGFHSQVSLASAQISQNDGPGVNAYAGSEITFYPGGPGNLIIDNGSAGKAAPGVRVDGNSHAYLRGNNEISNRGIGNQVPGIQVQLNSSVDLDDQLNVGPTAGSAAAINSNGIQCDYTSWARSGGNRLLDFSTRCIGGGRLR
jgi:hypothetical protein